MQKITVSANEAGQRLDKLLGKYLSNAPMSFVYKMLRKRLKLSQDLWRMGSGFPYCRIWISCGCTMW